MNIKSFEILFEKKIATIASSADPAHDLLHFKRVVALAKNLCEKEKGNPFVVIPAAWLHDFVIVPKDSPLRKQASRLSAEQAVVFLKSIDYPEQYLEDIAHAIEGHSFSANVEIRTLEARIVQDADRLDGLGAIGLARCFATAGLLKKPFYSEEDPFCLVRAADDSQFTIDHFYLKLFKVADNLKTFSGQIEGQRRVQIMKRYLADLNIEISKLEAAAPLYQKPELLST